MCNRLFSKELLGGIGVLGVLWAFPLYASWTPYIEGLVGFEGVAETVKGKSVTSSLSFFVPTSSFTFFNLNTLRNKGQKGQKIGSFLGVNVGIDYETAKGWIWGIYGGGGYSGAQRCASYDSFIFTKGNEKGKPNAAPVPLKDYAYIILGGRFGKRLGKWTPYIALGLTGHYTQRSICHTTKGGPIMGADAESEARRNAGAGPIEAYADGEEVEDQTRHSSSQSLLSDSFLPFSSDGSRCPRGSTSKHPSSSSQPLLSDSFLPFSSDGSRCPRGSTSKHPSSSSQPLLSDSFLPFSSDGSENAIIAISHPSDSFGSSGLSCLLDVSHSNLNSSNTSIQSISEMQNILHVLNPSWPMQADLPENENAIHALRPEPLNLKRPLQQDFQASAPCSPMLQEARTPSWPMQADLPENENVIHALRPEPLNIKPPLQQGFQASAPCPPMLQEARTPSWPMQTDLLEDGHVADALRPEPLNPPLQNSSHPTSISQQRFSASSDARSVHAAQRLPQSPRQSTSQILSIVSAPSMLHFEAISPIHSSDSSSAFKMDSVDLEWDKESMHDNDYETANGLKSLSEDAISLQKKDVQRVQKNTKGGKKGGDASTDFVAADEGTRTKSSFIPCILSKIGLDYRLSTRVTLGFAVALEIGKKTTTPFRKLKTVSMATALGGAGYQGGAPGASFTGPTTTPDPHAHVKWRALFSSLMFSVKYTFPPFRQGL
jgi:hypothetical protein